MYLAESIAKSRERSNYSLRSVRMRSGSSKDSNSGVSSFMSGGGDLSSILGSNDQEGKEQYERFRGWQYCAISAIAKRLASQPLNAGRITQKPSAKRFLNCYKNYELDRAPRFIKESSVPIEKITQHPLVDALSKPNDCMTRWAVLYVTTASLELTGLSYWWFRDGQDEFTGEPKLEIWPLPSHWVKPIHKGRLFSHYEISPGGVTNKKQIVPGAEIARFYLPSPSDPTGCVSPLQTQDRAVATDEMIQESQYSQFKNGYKPGVVMTAGRLPNDPVTGAPGERPILEAYQRRELFEALRGAYKGVKNADEPFIVDGLIESITPFTNTPAEMSYIESGNSTKSRILQAYQVNPLILGEIEGANRAQAAVAEDNFNNNVINPLCEQMSQVITNSVPRASLSLQTLPDDNRDMVFFFMPARSNDPDLKLAEWTAEPGPCVFVNEFRVQVLGLQPIEGGDVTVAEYNAERMPMGEGLIPQVGESEPAPPKKPKSFDVVKSSTSVDRKRKEKIWELQQAEAERGVKDEILRYLKSQHSEVSHKMSALYGTSEHLFEQTDRDSAKKNAATIANNIYNARKWTRVLLSDLDDVLFKAAMIGAATEISIIQINFRAARAKLDSKKAPRGGRSLSKPRSAGSGVKMPDKVVQRIDKAIKKSVKQPYWKNVAKNTRNKLADSIFKAIMAGKSFADMTKDVAKVLRGTTAEDQAEAIASTETTGAMNAGHDSVIRELGELVVNKTWFGTLDDVIRPAHLEAHGQSVKSTDNFVVGGEEAPYPGHPSLSAANRIRCRCSVISQTAFEADESMADDPELVAALLKFGITP